MNGVTHADDDSPWDESAGDSPTSASAAAQRDWERLRERFVNVGALCVSAELCWGHRQAGYREGITAGKASTVQAGFNQGFAAGAQAGQQLGRLRGAAAYILARLLAAPSDAAADPALVESARTLVRDLGRLGVEDVLGPDQEAIEHAREHGEVDVDALSGQMSGLGKPERGPTIIDCRTRLDQLLRSCGLSGLSDSPG